MNMNQGLSRCHWASGSLGQVVLAEAPSRRHMWAAHCLICQWGIGLNLNYDTDRMSRAKSTGLMRMCIGRCCFVLAEGELLNAQCSWKTKLEMALNEMIPTIAGIPTASTVTIELHSLRIMKMIP